MEQIRVLVVDDHDVVREGLAGFLRMLDDIDLVGEADNGEDAITIYRQLQPDVVLMDLKMPRMDGINATAAIRQHDPKAKVIILTSFGDDDLVQSALKAGALSYLLKNASVQEMASAIRAAARNQPTLSSEATQALIRSQIKPPKPNYNLKEREVDVLRRLVEGRTNDQIAVELNLCRATIKFHVSSILAKLGVESRTEAVSLTLREGLLDD